jgi:hypothetical protein
VIKYISHWIIFSLRGAPLIILACAVMILFSLGLFSCSHVGLCIRTSASYLSRTRNASHSHVDALIFPVRIGSVMCKPTGTLQGVFCRTLLRSALFCFRSNTKHFILPLVRVVFPSLSINVFLLGTKLPHTVIMAHIRP